MIHSFLVYANLSDVNIIQKQEFNINNGVLLISTQKDYELVKSIYNNLPEDYESAVWKKFIFDNVGVYVFKALIKEQKRFLNGDQQADINEKVISGIGGNNKPYKLAIKTVYEIEDEDLNIIKDFERQIELLNDVKATDTGFLEDIQLETMANLDLADEDKDLKGAKLLLSHNKRAILESFKIDKYSGRFHSALTAFDSDARKRIWYKGLKLVEVDIVSAQPSFLNALFKKKVGNNQIASEISKSIEEGRFYEFIMDISNVDRKLAKESVMWLLFSKWKNQQIIDGFAGREGEYKKQSEIIKIFLEWAKVNDRFFYQFIDEMKSDEIDPLPKKLQKMEVYIIKYMLKKIKEKGYIKGLYTVHDCIGCPEDVSKDILKIMEEASKELKISINFKIEN